MSMARMPGGRRQYSEDTRRMAFVFMGVLLVIFFLLVVRVALDKKSGRAIPLKPVRDRGQVIRTILNK